VASEYGSGDQEDPGGLSRLPLPELIAQFCLLADRYPGRASVYLSWASHFAEDWKSVRLMEEQLLAADRQPMGGE